MNGFWGESERAFVDVHVFNPFTPSNAASSVPCQLAIRSLKTQRGEHMDKGFDKLSMLHLLLWLCQPPVDWLMRQHIFINVLLPCCLINRGMSIRL